jgi:ATP sulfurylase
MMGVPLTEECAVFCHNSAVVTNSRHESTLKKKHAAINSHRVREAIAAGMIKVAKENTQTNLADILTKLMAGPKMKEFLRIYFGKGDSALTNRRRDRRLS